MARDRRSSPDVTMLTIDDALAHLDKATQYLKAAETALEAEGYDAAAGTAVLAGINAADCVSGIEQGNRWNGTHAQAPPHVKKGGTQGAAVASQLAKLLRRKTQAHYETTRLTSKEAGDLVQAARRAVAAATRAASTLPRS